MKKELAIVGDIGGTNSLFEILEIKYNRDDKKIDNKNKNKKTILKIETKTSLIKNISNFLKKKLKENEIENYKISNIVFACAGKVNNGEFVKLTNNNLEISKNKISRELKVPKKNIQIINDIEALYYSLKRLRKKDKIVLKTKSNKVSNLNNNNNKTLLISVGTGLGVFYFDNKCSFPTEASHLYVPNNLMKNKIYLKILKKLKKKELEWEDLISGKNLRVIFSVINNKLVFKKDIFDENYISNLYNGNKKEGVLIFEFIYNFLLEFILELNKIFFIDKLILAGGVIEKNLPNEKIKKEILKKLKDIEEIEIIIDHKNSLIGLKKLL